MDALLQQFRNFGAGRLTAILGLSIGVAVALVYFSGAVGGGSQALLYSGLDPADAAAASQRLDESGIEYEIREGGTAIYVPRDQVDNARVRVASDGPLGFGSVGYEIFDRQDSMGTTSFVQNVNAQRALQGELARTIQSLDVISSARVHLVLPERRLFERDRQEPSASVVVGVRGRLNSDQVRTIRNIVATAVPGLEPGRITLADESGRQLAGATDAEGAAGAVFDERRQAYEESVRQRILDVLEGVVGPGAARVQVSAELNRRSVTQSIESYDPEGQVIESRQRSEETSQDMEGRQNRVSAAENLPDQEEGGAGADGPTQTSSRERSDETINYLNSRTTRTEVIEAGSVERLSVAVAVDYAQIIGEEGAISYQPRSAEEMENLRALVRSAMGFDASRDDEPIVEQMEFARVDVGLGSPAAGGFSLDKNDIMRAAEIGVLFITAILIIFLVARPLVRGAQGVAAPALAGAGAGAGGGSGGPQIAVAPAPTALPGAAGAPAALPQGGAAAGPVEQALDIAKIDGQVKASSVKKVAGIVEQHPEESISILRTWLHEG